MARIQILSDHEEKVFNTPPVFSLSEQEYYFNPPKEWVDKLFEQIKPENIGFIILQYGYFRARNRFYQTRSDCDVAYVQETLSIPFINFEIPQSTRFRYYGLIKEMLGIEPLTPAIKNILNNEASVMSASFQDRKKIFYALVSLSRTLKIEIPSYSLLSDIIANALSLQKESMIANLRAYEAQENLHTLKFFMRKSDTFKNQYEIAAFKKLEHSSTRAKMNASLSLHSIIKNKFMLTKTIIDSIGITPKIAMYYAKWIDKSRIHQLTRKDELEGYFLLLCFVQHQYFIRNDNLIERFISIVQSAKNAALRVQKELTYIQAPGKNQTISSLENINLAMLNDIGRIANDESISSDVKIESIKQMLKTKSEELKRILSTNSADTYDMETIKYDVLEKKSFTLQGKLSGIVRAMEFDTSSSNKSLMEAIEYFKNTDNLSDKTPRAFLSNEEEKIVFENGKFRISLYKVLLFFAISDAIKSGILNLKYSYRFQSFEHYLIDKNVWKTSKDDLCEEYKISHLKDFKQFISPIAVKLETSFQQTNERIIHHKNTYFRITGDSFILSTPAVLKTDSNDTISKYLPSSDYISIIDILNAINKHTGFVKSLNHYNHTVASKVSEHLLFAAILGYGCNINIAKIGKISKGINPNQLDTAKTFYFTEENTMEANDKIIAFMENLDIVRMLRNTQELNHTASDGQKYNMKPSVESTNAGYSFKYFGTAKGVSVYTFIDESHRLFYSTVINVSERESGYVIDGLMHNDVIQSDIHSTDTHGFSEVIFGLTHLLGFSFAPRISNFKDQQLYSLSYRKEYIEKGYALVPKHRVNVEKIEEHWDDILRFIVTIKSKKSTASQLLHRLTSYSKQHRLYSAIKEFGKVIKTDFLLNYIDDLELRQKIEKQLNKVENSNKFSKAVFFGNNSEFTVATIEEQNIANNCKRLIQNSVILWNYLYMSQKLKESSMTEEKEEIIKAIRQGSIIHWQHINFYGEYDFTKLNRKNSAYLKDMEFSSLGIV